MTSWEIAILLIAIYVAVYGIVNRICTCVERCNMATSYASTVTNNQENNTGDVKANK